MVDPNSGDAAESSMHSGNRVLFVTPVAPWKLFGGTATVSRNLIHLFAASLDLHVAVLRADDPNPFPGSLRNASVLGRSVSGIVRKAKFFFDFRAGSFAHRQFEESAVRARFAELLAKIRPAFVIFDHVFSSWLIDLIDLIDPATTRVVYVAHDDMVAYADSLLDLQPPLLKKLRFLALRRQYRSVQEKVLRRADHVLTMTSEDATLLRAHTRGSVEVAPLFFEFPPSPREYPADFRYLLVTGSFDTWEKKLGLTQFLTLIFAPLLQRDPAWRLVIAGRIPPDVRQQIVFGEPQVRVVHGPTEAEMRTLVEEASAAVVLDRQASGLKIKTMELAAAGLPLVSWPPGLEGTGLVDNTSALRADSDADFIGHLERLFREPDLRRRLGKAAHATVQERFSERAALERWRACSLFSELAAAGAQRRPS